MQFVMCKVRKLFIKYEIHHELTELIDILIFSYNVYFKILEFFTHDTYGTVFVDFIVVSLLPKSMS